jgi:lysozyme family protein
MPTVRLTRGLRDEYDFLFDNCLIRANTLSQVEKIISAVVGNQGRYEAVSHTAGGGIPWYFIAVIHTMESSLNFNTHLHNGDPLTARTVHVPAGRPKVGAPPFAWEESAADALRLKKLDRWSDWSVAGLLYKLEEYNGWGYRSSHPEVLSPYLWSFSNHYTSGKYKADGVWSDSLVSKQCGAAVILRRMLENGLITFPEHTVQEPMVWYTGNRRHEYGEELQTFLNQFPGVYLNVDGKPGRKTSDAFKNVTGHYLARDPQADT